MASRRATREESFNSLPSGTSNEEHDDAFDGDDEDQNGPQLLTIGDVHRALHPLQATAERVGKQVEKFAEALDRLGPRNHGIVDVKVHNVIPLVCEYEKIASDTVRRLRRYHESERQEKLKHLRKQKSQKSNGIQTPVESNSANDEEEGLTTTVEDLEHWEQERQTWRLLRIMLEVPSSRRGEEALSTEKDARFIRPKAPATVHRYSKEQDVWNYFLATNDEMWEKHVVVEWLKSTADESGQDIDAVVEHLQSEGDAGYSIGTHGWLYSKEEIKGQKRLRSWPQPLAPDSPGIETSLLNSEKTGGLVTQLDPDAFSRQGRSLRKEDIFSEKAIWLACWEMLRRGRSWKSIKEWCSERSEVWRAISMRGDPRFSYDSSDTQPDLVAGWNSRTLWRKMCANTARNGGVDDYERAVYGLLSGDLSSVEKVIQGWDDYVFAHYNSQLLQSFDLFVQKSFPERLPKAMTFKLGRPDINSMITPPTISGRKIWDTLMNTKLTKEEALRPMKMLQGSLIARCAPNYLWEQGLRIGQLMLEGEPESQKLLRTREPAKPTGATADISLEDYDMLRILTHVSFIYQELKPLPEEATAIENIVVAYIDYLGKAGKQQLLPLYASRLSKEGATNCMARQLPSIIDNGERRTVLRLMQQYGLGVPQILLTQLAVIMLDKPPDVKDGEVVVPLRILEPINGKKNALPQIKRNFVGNDISPEDMDLINGMEWFLLIEKHWTETMRAGSILYKYFFLSGALAAARELSHRASFSAISLNKTETILGESVDLSIFSDDENYEEPNSRRSTRKQASKEQKSKTDLDTKKERKEYLLDEANTFRDFENLACALEALESWKEVADEYTNQVDPRHAKAWKSELQKAHDAVVYNVTPLLKGWLQHPSTDKELQELNSIRVAYLPEIVLAYNTVLSIGGQFLSRDVLLKSMDLAALAADEEDGSDLLETFVQAGRVGELVDALAMSSKTILRADEMGAKQGKKGRKTVEGLGLWTVGK